MLFMTAEAGDDAVEAVGAGGDAVAGDPRVVMARAMASMSSGTLSWPDGVLCVYCVRVLFWGSGDKEDEAWRGKDQHFSRETSRYCGSISDMDFENQKWLLAQSRRGFKIKMTLNE